MENLVLFAVVNLLASALSGVTGGGGGLISTPFMVFLGLSPATAIATAKFGGLGISMGTSARFYKENATDKRTVVIFSIFAAAGALAGSLILTQISTQTELLENLMGIIILAVGIPLLYLRNLGLETKKQPRYLEIIGFVLLTLSVLLQAALSAGIGSLQLVVMMGCFGMTAITANATRRFMQLTVAVVSLLVLIIAGLIDYDFAVVSFVTSLIGGYIGAHIAVKKGNKFVINLFAITSALLAINLLIN